MADALQLARLARVREVQRRQAGEAAAASGARHDRLRGLANRSRDLADGYASRLDVPDGAALTALLTFHREIGNLNARAVDDAQAALIAADQARLALSTAQQRCDLVRDRLELSQSAELQRRGPDMPHLAQSLNRRGASRTYSRVRRNEP